MIFGVDCLGELKSRDGQISEFKKELQGEEKEVSEGNKIIIDEFEKHLNKDGKLDKEQFKKNVYAKLIMGAEEPDDEKYNLILNFVENLYPDPPKITKKIPVHYPMYPMP